MADVETEAAGPDRGVSSDGMEGHGLRGAGSPGAPGGPAGRGLVRPGAVVGGGLRSAGLGSGPPSSGASSDAQSRPPGLAIPRQGKAPGPVRRSRWMDPGRLPEGDGVASTRGGGLGAGSCRATARTPPPGRRDRPLLVSVRSRGRGPSSWPWRGRSAMRRREDRDRDVPGLEGGRPCPGPGPHLGSGPTVEGPAIVVASGRERGPDRGREEADRRR